MTNKLLYLISVVFGVLIVFTIGASNVHSYQATDYSSNRITSQNTEVAQAKQTQRNALPECPWRCARRWGVIPRRSCEDMEKHVYTDPNRPVFVQGVNEDCYRLDWDEDKDGNISLAEYAAHSN